MLQYPRAEVLSERKALACKNFAWKVLHAFLLDVVPKQHTVRSALGKLAEGFCEDMEATSSSYQLT